MTVVGIIPGCIVVVDLKLTLLWTAVVWMKEWEGLEGSIMYMLDSEIGKRDCTSAVSSLDIRSDLLCWGYGRLLLAALFPALQA